MAKAARRSRTRGRPVSKSARRSQNRGRPASKSRSTSRSRGRSRGRSREPSNKKRRRSKKVGGSDSNLGQAGDLGDVSNVNSAIMGEQIRNELQTKLNNFVDLLKNIEEYGIDNRYAQALIDLVERFSSHSDVFHSIFNEDSRKNDIIKAINDTKVLTEVSEKLTQQKKKGTLEGLKRMDMFFST